MRKKILFVIAVLAAAVFAVNYCSTTTSEVEVPYSYSEHECSENCPVHNPDYSQYDVYDFEYD